MNNKLFSARLTRLERPLPGGHVEEEVPDGDGGAVVGGRGRGRRVQAAVRVRGAIAARGISRLRQQAQPGKQEKRLKG